MGSPYSSLKIFHHQERLNKLRNAEGPVLLHVQLIPTNRCNQNCSFCSYRMDGYSSNEDFEIKDQIPLEDCLKIVRDCHVMGVKAIEITGGGEPTIYPGFVQLCEQIYDYEIDCGVVSNGTNMTDEVIEVLSKAKWVRFSIDSGLADTYAYIRKSTPDQFYQTRYRIRRLVKTRNDDEDNELLIGVGFVVTKDNYEEIVHAARNAKEDGVDNFRISAIFQNEGVNYFEDFYEEARDLTFEAQALQDDSFTVFNLFGERINDLEQQFPDYSFCGYQHFVTYIGADMNVYRCCNTSYNPRGLLGSLREQSLIELWDKAQEALFDFDARRCPLCMFNEKNKRILYALDDDPKHVNFL